MPKAPRKSNKVYAYDESPGYRLVPERIIISKETKAKFKDVGKRRSKKPTPIVPRIRCRPPLTPEQEAEVLQQHKEHEESRSLLHRLLVKRQTLEERINKWNAERLIDRIEPLNDTLPTIPPPVLKNLHEPSKGVPSSSEGHP